MRNYPIVDNKYRQTITGEKNSLLELYKNVRNENSNEIGKLGGYLERALAYDAVWVMAYALDKTLKR